MGGGPAGGIGTLAEPGASAFSKGVTTSSSSLAAPGASVFSKGMTTSSFQDIERRILPDASATHSSMASSMSLSLSKRRFAWGQTKELMMANWLVGALDNRNGYGCFYRRLGGGSNRETHARARTRTVVISRQWAPSSASATGAAASTGAAAGSFQKID